MKPNYPNQPKKYFNTKDKWVEITPAEKRLTELKRETETNKLLENKRRKNKDQIYRHCIEYWDDIKEKYKYNHLYRKRVLKVKQEDLQKSVEIKSKLDELFNKDGEVMAQYVNKSNDINVRGEGVWRLLNGEESVATIDESTESKESTKPSTIYAGLDLIDDLRKCVVDKSELSQSEVLPSGSLPHSIEQHSLDNHQCTHILSRAHKKLFNIPECIDEESMDKESSIVAPTIFEWCMKELHELKSPTGSVKMSQESEKIDDPWCKFEKCQVDKYGYSDEDFCRSEAEEDETPEELSDVDFYEKIVHKIIEKEIRISGAKLKIKDVLGVNATDDICDQVKSADLTAKGKDNVLLQSLDIRREEHVNEEREDFKNVMDTLVGEWTTMGMFLKELAENSAMLTAKRAMSVHNRALPKRTLGPLGKNVHKMMTELLEKDETEAETKDLNVSIKYEVSQSKCYPQSYNPSSCFGKDHTEKNVNLSYREKQEYNIKWDKKGEKMLSKQSATKKVFDVGTNQTKSFTNSLLNSPISTDFNRPKSDDRAKKTFHRGLVELISGSKYAGSWNQLGMEGCGKYISPGGTIIDGNMSDGVFNGPATIYLPNGLIIAGAFDNGKFHSPKITFGDGLEYKNERWEYLKETKKLSKNQIRLYKPILDREIPDGCYDVGEGFYNPKTKLIYHPITLAPIRSVSEREEKWIVSICRAAQSKCVSLDEHLYEVVDIPMVQKNLKNPYPLPYTDPWSDCHSPFYNRPLKDDDPREQRVSIDRLIQIDEKSKPVELLWNSVRQLTGAHRAKVGVPFSYEKAVHYTCNDHLLKQI